MNVLFVTSVDADLLPNGRLHYPNIQFGISLISSFLRKHGHRTELLVLGRRLAERNFANLDARIEAFQPKLICFTAVAPEYEVIRAAARHAKKAHPGVFLAIGGVHATLNPDAVAADDFDAVCVGEGEWPALELATQLEEGRRPTRIANLWIKNGSAVERNAPRPFMQDLDSMPFPDREMWRPWLNDQAPTGLAALVGRGCPFNCSYCSNHALRKVAPGRYTRCRNPENVVAELDEIRRTFPSVRTLAIECETITCDTRWCLDLCAALERWNAPLPRRLSFQTNVRVTPNLDLEPVFAAFKRAGVDFINIGVESGSDRVRREVLRRRYSNEDVTRTVSLARKHGLRVGFYVLIGIPAETLADFQETIALCRTCQPDRIFRFIYFPYPGTDLAKRCGDMGLLREPLDTRNERELATLDLPGFSKSQIQTCYDYFEYFVRKGYEPNTIWPVKWARRAYELVSRVPIAGAAAQRFKRLGKKIIGSPYQATDA